MRPTKSQYLKWPFWLCLTAAITCLTACDNTAPQTANAHQKSTKKNSGKSSFQHFQSLEDQHDHEEDQKDDNQAQSWPISKSTAKIKQVSKHIKRDILLNKELAAISNFEGNQLPYQDIIPINVETVTVKSTEILHDTNQWAFIDVRKDKDFYTTGTIPGSIHLEYKFEKAIYNGETNLTKEKIQEILKNKRGVIFFCNGPKCPRSFNASIAAVNQWGISPEKIKWYRNGAPAWDMHLLVKPFKK